MDYCNKYCKLNIKLLDGQTKTLMVDDSQTVGQLMIYICSQMGIANHEEYSLIHDVPESEKERTLTMRRDKATLPRDFKKLENMKRKLHTDDDSKLARVWVAIKSRRKSFKSMCSLFLSRMARSCQDAAAAIDRSKLGAYLEAKVFLLRQEYRHAWSHTAQFALRSSKPEPQNTSTQTHST